MTTWQNAHYADGPALADWFRAHGLLDGEGQDSSLSRRARAWANGERPSFDAVDRWLTAKGYHPSELPDELWLRDPVVDALLAGQDVKATAARFGLHPKTVRDRRDRVAA